jgi:hypothetical protein
MRAPFKPQSNMKKLFALALLATILSGCVVVPEYGGPPMCPPGQAKEGRC